MNYKYFNFRSVLAATIFVSGFGYTPVILAADSTKETLKNEAENSTSHNPLTRTTTSKIKRKAKYKHKGKGKTVNAEDTLEIEKKTADDGSKTSVTTEETHTETPAQ